MKRAYSYIRFSTPEQRKGNSLERQLRLSREYAKKNGLILDETLNLQDLGVSAYRSANLKGGALGVFLKAVEDGTVKSGSVLLVESLDRLSRAELTRQLSLFLRLIESGITIVTLLDQMVYSEQTVNENGMQLFASLMVMSRAHEESATKAKRLRASWASKREKQAILTSRCPAWVRLNGAGVFEKIPDRCALIGRIFKMADAGIGQSSIAKTLNREGVGVWGRGHGWHCSYVQKILKNRSVLGEFQPHEVRNGKRVPVGDPIPKYFPQVITAALFQKVNVRRSQNRLFLGKAGKGVGNLFTGIVKCGYTGEPMIYVNKGQQRYLVSDSARRGRGGQYVSWPYRDFETAFLTYVSELDFSSIIDGDQNIRIATLEAELGEKRDAMEQTERRIKKYMDAIEEDTSPPSMVMARIAELERTKASLGELVQSIEEQVRSEKSGVSSLAEQAQALKEFKKKRDTLEFRYLLRSLIRSTVKRIDVFAAGPQFTRALHETVSRLPDAKERKQLLKIVRKSDDPDFYKWLTSGKKIKPWDAKKFDSQPIRKEERYFMVTFTTGNVKCIKPEFSDPTRYAELDVNLMGRIRELAA